MKSDRGSLHILLAGYLALAVLVGLSFSVVGLSLIAQNRIQAIADSAVVFAHDRSVRKGIPNLTKLKVNTAEFLQNSATAQGLSIQSIEVKINHLVSQVTICGLFQNPLAISISSGLICKTAYAQSFRTD